MTRRSFPHIDPADLRQHADEDRVERVWQRVERDLSGRAEGSSRVRSPLVLLAAAAAFGAFGAGILVGKTASSRAAAPSVTLAEPARDKSLVEVLAAGTHQSSFPLEGGGRVTLSPGATVEVERAGGAVTLSLLQGEASLDSAGRALTITAGDARINTQAGSVLTMRRTADDLDVKVDEGAVNVLSPDGQAVVGKSEHKVLPVRASAVVATMDAKATRDHAQQARRLPKPRLGAAKPLVVAEWYALYTRDDEKGAIASLRKLGVSQAIDAAHGAAELDAIAQLMGKGGLDAGAEIRAYERLVSAFPSDQRASLAAGRLARIYEATRSAPRSSATR
jgi:hypothetical protein